MGIKQLEQVSDRQGQIALEGVRENGVIERDVEIGVQQCALDDWMIPLFVGDGVSADAARGDAGGVRVFRKVVMDLGKRQTRALRHKGFDLQASGEQ